MEVSKPIVREDQRMRPDHSEVLKLLSDNRLAREKDELVPASWRLTMGFGKQIEFVQIQRDLFTDDRYVR